MLDDAFVYRLFHDLENTVFDHCGTEDYSSSRVDDLGYETVCPKGAGDSVTDAFD